MDKYKPFLKWAGRKHNCLKYLLPHFPQANCLLEPFAGSASVFLGTDYSKYILAEENNDLICVLKYLQQEGKDFIDDCAKLFIKENNIKEQYYALREQFNLCSDPRQRALYFVYLNRHGYNGLCRYNSSGGYNVPFGSYVNPQFQYRDMEYFAQNLQNAIVIKQDFRKTFDMAQIGDVIYCDPPYVPIVQHTNFASYIEHKFSTNDQIDLANLAKAAAARGITVIISNHDTEFTRLHYNSAQIYSFDINRTISCKVQNRLSVKELIAVFPADGLQKQ